MLKLSTRISYFYPPTDSEYNFHKTGIENWETTVITTDWEPTYWCPPHWEPVVRLKIGGL